ncbi:MAG: hypothetical protein HY316_07685 [Acidobacteria bacterium]|nr:hypothetical protein [Acidobacteriota bacterium]
MVTNCKFKRERLVYWYLRLNGFLTIENFVVHPERSGSQRTDADILAVRFRNRKELFVNPMEDDPRVCECGTLCNVIIAEAKRNRCDLNGPWTHREKKNINRVLRAMGCFAPNENDRVAESLYSVGRYDSSCVTCRLFAFGESTNDQLKIPVQQQVIWKEAIDFIVKRFKEYRNQKRDVGQWSEDGTKLQEAALGENSTEIILNLFCL